MKWYFLIISILGMPFTAGWSLLLGILMFFFMSIGGAHHARAIQDIKQAPTPIHTIGAGCWSLLVTLGIGAVFLAAMLAVGMMAMEGRY